MNLSRDESPKKNPQKIEQKIDITEAGGIGDERPGQCHRKGSRCHDSAGEALGMDD